MNTAKGKIPAFFMVFIPELLSQRMKIPSAFTCYMKGKLTDNAAFLRNHRGNVWPVDVTGEGRDLYFEKGWVRFVEDNNVELGDFLVFQFNGDYFFDLKHLGKSCCKKETVGSFKFIVNQEEIKAGIEDSEEEEEEEEKEEEEEEEEGIEFETFSSRVKKTGKNTKAGKKGKSIMESKNTINGEGADDIFKSGLIDPPKNPYFVAQQNKRLELFIPMDVIIDHQLKIPEEIIITTKDGWEYVAEINSWGDGRKVMTDGWRAFCARYQVKEGELCLCEFVPPQTQKLLLQVLHFHRGKWIPRT